MPAAALVLAILLHLMAGAVLWWLPPFHADEPKDAPIMVSFDSAPSNVGLSRSSGVPALDTSSMNLVRAAGPYPPMPSELGAQHSFTLPLYFRRNE